jgi:hypothetical protein
MAENSNNDGSNINLDPVRTPVLYADSVSIKSSETGVVMDFMQQVGPTNQYVVIARIGVSKDHAKLIIDNLDGAIRIVGKKSTTNTN